MDRHRTATGTTAKAPDIRDSLRVRRDTLQYMIKTAGFVEKSAEKVMDCWLPQHFCTLEYDDDDDEKPVYLCRYPPSPVFDCSTQHDLTRLSTISFVLSVSQK